MKILVVDDDRPNLKLLGFLLREEGYEVTTVEDGLAAINMIRHDPPDLVLLDIMMPHIDGLEVCRAVRKTTKVPIIFLTAKGRVDDKVVGLKSGADDYLPKPFEPAELLARIEAVLRRSGGSITDHDSMPITGGGLRLDPLHHQVIRERDGSEVDLTPTEFRLLSCLMQNQGRVLTPTILVEKVWGYDYEGESNPVAVYIRRLRIKIEEDPRQPRHITTVRGHGYRFEPDE